MDNNAAKITLTSRQSGVLAPLARSRTAPQRLVERCRIVLLRSQMTRASRSVPHNIGEGVGKRGKARVASYEIALGEAKELIVALDCVEIDRLADTAEIVAAQDLADRVSAMLTKLIRSV